MPRQTLRYFAVLALLLLAGCTGSAPEPRPAAPVNFSALLGAPADLPRRDIAFTEEGLRKDGADWEQDLPWLNVSADGPLARFSPSFDGADPDLGAIGLAFYVFDLADYDREPSLSFSFSQLPADYANWYLGLVNHVHNTYDWFPGPLDNRRDNIDLTQYRSATGELTAIVIFIGHDEVVLDSLRIGEPLPPVPPVAALSASPDNGLAPLDVVLDAAASVDPDGGALRFEWDLDGDGTFEVDGGGVATLQHTFDTAQQVDVAVRVTDDENDTDTATAHVSVVDDPGPGDTWARSWGLGAEDTVADVTADADGNVYAVGWTYSIEGRIPLFLKYDPAGNLLWARTWQEDDATVFNDFARSVATGPDGSVYVRGTRIGSFDWSYLLWKLSPAGVLEWTREYTNHQVDVVYSGGIVADAGGPFITGQLLGGVGRHVAAHFDTNGNLAWDRALNADLRAVYDIARDQNNMLYVAGETFDNNAVVLGLTTAGAPGAGAKYIYANGKCVSLDCDAAGNVYGLIDHNAIVWVKLSPDMQLLSQQRYARFGSDKDPTQLAAAADGTLYIAAMHDLDLSSGTLLKFDPAGTLQWTRKFVSTFPATILFGLDTAGDALLLGGWSISAAPGWTAETDATVTVPSGTVESYTVTTEEVDGEVRSLSGVLTDRDGTRDTGGGGRDAYVAKWLAP
jgi:PKD repeat protein